MLVFSNRIPYPGANHVAPPAAKDEKEYRTRSPPRRNRRSSGSSRKPLGVRAAQEGVVPFFVCKNFVWLTGYKLVLPRTSR